MQYSTASYVSRGNVVGKAEMTWYHNLRMIVSNHVPSSVYFQMHKRVHIFLQHVSNLSITERSNGSIGKVLLLRFGEKNLNWHI